MAKVTVLIADDLKLFLEIEKSYLQRGGFEVLTAMSGVDAVSLALSRQPNLILLDLEMPKMDGATACAEMRKNPALAATPIIIMSATGSTQNRDRCVSAGCTEFVTKPQKPDELLGMVARILSLKKRESERITVVFNITGKDATRQVIGQAKDLSESGLLMVTHSPITVGAVLQIEFFLPGTRSQIKVQGKVVRQSPGSDGTHEVAVRFTDLSQDDRALILDYAPS
ncbi:MAG TPA: response regulator [Candidatus Polarisedimenticolia bacterium]|nr:response regulator [Candidatus Polarisedimenticolia bacterium]